jgi:NTE family protein
MTKKFKIGLALSGGGIRGIAHVGVIKALMDSNIVPEAVIGTSAGAIIGALYAAGKTPEQMMQFTKEWSLLRSVRLGFSIDGLTSLTFLKEHLLKHIGHDSFEQLERPFFVGVTNMNEGTLEVINSGSLTDTVMASSAIPLIFKPVEINGKIYVDGGVMSNLAVEPLRTLCDVLIGVDVMATGVVDSKSLSNVIGIASRLFTLGIVASARQDIAKCDIVIQPSVGSYQIFKILSKDFSNIYETGLLAAQEKLETLHSLLLPRTKDSESKFLTA